MPYQTRARRSFNGRPSFGANNYKKRSSNRRPAKNYINPDRFVARATHREVAPYEPTHAFNDFDLHERLKGNLTAKGFEHPTPIQDQAIPLALVGNDVIGIAGTGTGKTAAFALPVIHRIMTGQQNAAIIIAPTRELAQQIEEECRSLGKQSRLRSALLIGGTSMRFQLRDLSHDPNIVIGTPGRIKDHLDRGTLKLAHFDVVVLDEVDRMLDMGFVNDINEIINQTNPERQCLLFSATMDNRVRKLIDAFATNPVTIELQVSKASENVNQDVVRFEDNADKLDKLHDLLLHESMTKAIIFDETQRSVERLKDSLVARGFETDAIHGGKTQGQRQRALSKFKNNDITILVATDVAARGIDIADITHVFNYTVPQEYEDYVHRVGRAGRAGREGYAYTFINQR